MLRRREQIAKFLPLVFRQKRSLGRHGKHKMQRQIAARAMAVGQALPSQTNRAAGLSVGWDRHVYSTAERLRFDAAA
jgi:hypothetical protein